MKTTLFSADMKAQRTVGMEKLVELIRSGYKTKQVAALREALRYIRHGVSVKQANRLPVVYFCSTFKKQDKKLVRKEYNGLILLKINNLTNRNEAEKVRRQASASLQTMAAFIGSSGKSVKIVIPFRLSDNTVPQNDTLIQFFHKEAYTGRLLTTGKPYNRISPSKKTHWTQPAASLSIRIFITIRTHCLSGSNNRGSYLKIYPYLPRCIP
ncbi:BT4734/BF3469 family protein [Parabacteroides timonensis]|uniref:BT4734/BF3469 family protein n=1 Tax=Parabacteroides timonensis TaxID=1871013 RepID=UPI001F4291CE|nr:BT4734/BF3469 family protein [Parabacteroides timonensis]